MTKRNNQNVVDSEPGTEVVDRAMNLTMGKRGNVTCYTMEADAEQAKTYMPAFGTNDADFFYGLLQQVVNAGEKGQDPDEQGVKFMLAFIRSREPRDELETSLLSQMAATHVAVMRYTNRLAHAESLREQESAERALNKLIRTFNMQVVGFQHYRFMNERKMIGNVTRPREWPEKKRGRERLVLRDGRTPMGIIDGPQRAPIPLRRGQKA
jgi:hypothetical protein